MDDLKLAQTTFWLDSHRGQDVENFSLHPNPDGHEPTPKEDSLAPFYQDPSQRILALEFGQDGSVFVMKTEVLLELAREHGGTELGWGQWRAHVIEIVHVNKIFLWVSGPRLFCIRPEDDDARVDVYDFSPRASARYIQEVAYIDGGIMRKMEPNSELPKLPWYLDEIHYANGGHDGIVFLEVSALVPKA